MAEDMSEEEIKVYMAGFQAGFYHIRGIILNWAMGKEAHTACKCSLCMVLRQIADGDYGDLKTPEKHT